MTTKPQTKSNAKRSAETATRRTGIEHSIKEADGGWVVVGPLAKNAETETPSFPEPDTAWIYTESQAVADALEADNQREKDAPTADLDNSPTDDATADTEASHDAPQALKRANLRQAAETLLAAWDASPAQDATDNPISRAVEGIRAALAGKPTRAPREAGAPRKPREGTKQALVLGMLRRDEGASVHQIAGATNWVPNTVRGFLAGLKKKGIKVKNLGKVRNVGPDAKGGHTIYHINAAIEG